ncbi:hypothetical protein [Candidatus Accumulibacter sp. ACC007]|nr:hypothetical protein [Candidatus Accumulibacter sp. ACC007]
MTLLPYVLVHATLSTQVVLSHNPWSIRRKTWFAGDRRCRILRSTLV